MSPLGQPGVPNPKATLNKESRRPNDPVSIKFKQGDFAMANRFMAPMISLVAISIFAPAILRAQDRQPGAVYDRDRRGEKPAPASKHDISGTWEPAQGAGGRGQGERGQGIVCCE